MRLNKIRLIEAIVDGANDNNEWKKRPLTRLARRLDAGSPDYDPWFTFRIYAAILPIPVGLLLLMKWLWPHTGPKPHALWMIFLSTAIVGLLSSLLPRRR